MKTNLSTSESESNYLLKHKILKKAESDNEKLIKKKKKLKKKVIEIELGPHTKALIDKIIDEEEDVMNNLIKTEPTEKGEFFHDL